MTKPTVSKHWRKLQLIVSLYTGTRLTATDSAVKYSYVRQSICYVAVNWSICCHWKSRWRSFESCSCYGSVSIRLQQERRNFAVEEMKMTKNRRVTHRLRFRSWAPVALAYGIVSDYMLKLTIVEATWKWNVIALTFTSCPVILLWISYTLLAID